MQPLIIDVGVYTPLIVDLTQFDFSGVSKVVLTISNPRRGVKIEREFDTAAEYQIEITPAESKTLVPGAQYDFDIVLPDGKRYKNGENGSITLRTGAGEWTPSV